jgi:hypothetical protein
MEAFCAKSNQDRDEAVLGVSTEPGAEADNHANQGNRIRCRIGGGHVVGFGLVDSEAKTTGHSIEWHHGIRP